MPFKILYTIFLVACLFYPFEYIIGPVTIRHIIAFVLLVMLIDKKQVKFDWVLWVFVAYLFFFVIASIVTGYLITFIPTLIGTYVTCIVMYLATKTMMKENAGSWILYTLLTIAVIDSVVTIAQFFNHPLAKNVADMLRINLIDEEEWDKYDMYGGGMGGIVSGGLLRGVKNGYFLCSAVVFSIINKKNHVRLVNIVFCVIIFVALFFTQERAAFYLGILCLVVYITIDVLKQNRRAIIALFAVIVLIVFSFGYIQTFFDFSETRYAIMGSESAGRELFWKKAFDYIKMNPLGGSYDFYAQGGYPPHNFIPNSYLNGGIIGGTLIVSLVIIQVFLCIKILFQAFFKKEHSMFVVALALIYLGYTGNSCFHNLCLCTGDETAFMWWAIFVSLLYQEKFNVNAKEDYNLINENNRKIN